MRVAVVNLVSGGSGGALKYWKRMVPLLESDHRISELALFVPAQDRGGFASEGVAVHGWEDGVSGLCRAVQRFGPDVVFTPTARWINFGAVPSVVMVRNMEPLVAPFKGNELKEGIRNLARRYAARRACLRANKVIAVSSFTRSFLSHKWKIDNRKMSVIYHGVDPPAAPDQTRRPSAVPENLDAPFLFSAGSIRSGRGLEDIVKAVPRVISSRKCVLVHAGAPSGGDSYARGLQALANTLGVSQNIIWAGQLDPMEMSWCYLNCAAFVMTSRVEACPNVVLEALAHGCLSVSTDSPPMPEFFEDAALYYAAGDAAELAGQLQRLLQPREDFADLKSRALERSRQFTWGETARKTVDMLVSLAGDRAMVG